MPSPARGSASYKKKDGALSLTNDSNALEWTPANPPGALPALTVKVEWITNLQATPASLPKVMLKVFAQSPNATTPDTHVFTFTSASAARQEADGLKDALSAAIQKAKAATEASTGTSLLGGGGMMAAEGQSAAMAMASAVSSNSAGGGDADWLDDDRLRGDNALQRSLLKADPLLSKTFMESLRTKPDSITASQFSLQFWSTRLHMLRAHAIANNQTRGAYNVLSTIKPKTVDNELKLKITPEQIQLIFKQHPLVKRVYDENVPRLNEKAFWERFFGSKLFKKLKGEKIGDADAPDAILDKYLREDDEVERTQRMLAAHIPHVIDLEGNEENHSQRKGNQPDWTMRPTAVDKVPIIRTLNSLSEKIMSQVTPIDVDPSEPIGMDEETFNALALRDLQGDAQESRIILHIKDQKRFFANDTNDDDGEEALYAEQNPQDLIIELDLGLQPVMLEADAKRGVDIEGLIAFVDESDSGEDEDEEEGHETSAHQHRQNARLSTTQIRQAIASRRAQTDDHKAAKSKSDAGGELSYFGLSSTIFERLQLTHATTTEFLHHFWLVFLSGDASRAGELASLVESLDRALNRINAVAQDADEERSQRIEARKVELQRAAETSGRRKKHFDESTIGGGARVVREMLSPTVKAVGAATAQYRKALAAETVEGG